MDGLENGVQTAELVQLRGEDGAALWIQVRDPQAFGDSKPGRRYCVTLEEVAGPRTEAVRIPSEPRSAWEAMCRALTGTRPRETEG